eukprot:22752-Lingulodinium_polyedra.AAC.1
MDNLGVVLALSKGRARDYGLLRIAQRAACIMIACDIKCRVRWIPSEVMPADRASRRHDPAPDPTAWGGRGARAARDASA